MASTSTNVGQSAQASCSASKIQPPAPATSTSSIEEAVTTTASGDDAQFAAVPLSKNAQKRLLKQQKFEAIKHERRHKERERKRERVAERRRLAEQGIVDPAEALARANKKLRLSGPKQPFDARVVIDCAFDELMNDREIKSMASQLGFCYSANKSSARPLKLMVSGFSGRLKTRFEGLQDRPHEAWRGVEWWEEGYEELWSETNSIRPGKDADDASSNSAGPNSFVQIGALKGKPRSRVPKNSVVYLTGDSPNVLSSIEEGKTYILGGIVDRNRHKLLCLEKAERDGIAHAQLPIGEHVPELQTRKVLTVNQVYDIIVRWVEQRDWKQALRSVMPERKLAPQNGKTASATVDTQEGQGTDDNANVDDQNSATDEAEAAEDSAEQT